MKYIFLGSSPDSARTINFMGQYEFTVGEPVDVTTPEVLDKLKTHKFFKMVENEKIATAVDLKFTAADPGHSVITSAEIDSIEVGITEKLTLPDAVKDIPLTTVPKKRGRPKKVK